MLRSRIIPCLLIHKNELFKTVRFKAPKYIGDPINAVRIFNEKEVDEIIVIDIDATFNKSAPNYSLIEKIADECRMPLCYGGGIKTPEQAMQIIAMGVEKVSISSIALQSPHLIKEIASAVGNQSVVVTLDVKSNFLGKQTIYTHNGTINTKLDPVIFARTAEQNGAGELVINSIDRDGTLSGYDKDLVYRIRDAISLPITILGGAGSLDDIRDLVSEHKVIGASAGSLFVFKGKYRAVLINYPTESDKKYALNLT